MIESTPPTPPSPSTEPDLEVGVGVQGLAVVPELAQAIVVDALARGAHVLLADPQLLQEMEAAHVALLKADDVG